MNTYKINIRRLKAEDIGQCIKLFKETVHSINAKDYTPEQLEIWTRNAANPEYERWKAFITNFSFVATLHSEIVGFIELLESGYLDHLYVHKDYQSRGIATELLREVEQLAKSRALPEIVTEASITAKPFFEAMGYKVCNEQRKIVSGIQFTTFMMKKVL
jgi:putative acetyltransferase